MDCECKGWCSDGRIPILSHHPRCQRYNPVKDMSVIVIDLLKGVECWASDEDGVHPECFEAYKRAKVAMGQLDFLKDKKMKVVINRCYGGFSLSPLAVKCMAELNGKECYFFSSDYKPITIEEAEKELCFFAITTPIFNDHNSVRLETRPENRADPILVQVVEELGAKANGGYAELGIVEIPDGIEWEIDEYDGIESVSEKHRSWS